MEEIRELQRFFAGFVKSGGNVGVGLQAVFSRSCMAFCCVSFSVDMHCVHSPGDTWGGRKSTN